MAVSAARWMRAIARGSPLDLHRVLDLQVIEHALDDLVVEVVAAEVVVAVAGDHLDHALLDAHDRDVEGPAAEIVDQHPFALLLRRLVDQGRRGRLVDDADHLEPGDLAGFAGRLPLRVGKIRRDRDHRLPHWLTNPISAISFRRRRIIAEMSCGV